MIEHLGLLSTVFFTGELHDYGLF